MKLICLGTGGYHPSERRHTACYYLPEPGIVLDAGTGMFRLAAHLNRQTSTSLDILLTHAHLDHTVGLTYLLQLHGADMQRVTVHAEEVKLNAIKTHLFSNLIFPVLPPIRFQPLTGPLEVSGCQISWFGLHHPGGSVGYRLDFGQQSMAYVTDTTADAQAPYVDAIRDVDLLVHECHFADDQAENAKLTGHSCVSQVAHVAAACRADQLLLIHINPRTDNDDRLLETAQAIFANTRLATDGMTVEF